MPEWAKSRLHMNAQIKNANGKAKMLIRPNDKIKTGPRIFALNAVTTCSTDYFI